MSFRKSSLLFRNDAGHCDTPRDWGTSGKNCPVNDNYDSAGDHQKS